MLPTGARPLLAAKLRVPPTRPGAVLRARLHERLRAARATKLTTVVAPAGWGKTTLLAAWAQDLDERRPVGWLSIDETDDEPVRFFTYALSALDAVAPALARDALAALAAPGLDPVGVAVAALLNAASAADDQYVLVLDDYHLLTDPAIHEQMEFLLAYLPPGLRIVVAGRTDPPLPLARLRARGELTEIRVGDLRCTPAEGAALVTTVGGVPVAAADHLVERTEGWAAGLHLTALALREAPDPTAAAATVRGDERSILDFFTAEVLADLSPEARDLLVRGSVLERLSGPLCDAALATTGAAAALDRLDRAAVFLSALGDGWYRCHRLFRDVLRRELDARDGTSAAAVLTRAADWFLAQGRVEEAVEHRLAADDHRGAVDLVREHFRWYLDRGAMAALLRTGERVAATAADPALYVTLAWAAGLTDRPEESARWLTRAEPLITADAEPLSGWRSLRAAADSAWATYGLPGDLDAALRYGRRTAELEDDPGRWGYVVARQSLAGAFLGAGRFAEAIDVLREVWEVPVRHELPMLFTLQSAGQYAFALGEAGEVARARAVIAEVAAAADAAEKAWGDGAAAAVAVLRLAEARLAAARDPAAALPALRRAVEVAEAWARATVIVSALTSLASAHWATGDSSAARSAMDRAREAAAMGYARPLSVAQLDELEARIGRGASRGARARGDLVEELTDRETAVLRALRGPLTAREIGAELHLSINTVKGYAKSLYRKLGVETRADAVRRGHELGLI